MPLNSFLTRLILLCVVPLVALAVVLAMIYVYHVQAENEAQADGLSKSLMSAIDTSLSARIAGLQMLAASPLADDAATWKTLYQEAQGFRHSFGSHVVLVGSNLQVLLNTRLPFGSPQPALPRPTGRSAIQLAMETRKPAVGDQFMGPVAVEPLIAIATPSLRNDRISHFFVTTIETRQFQHVLDQALLPPGWMLSLRDSTNEVMACRVSVPSNTATTGGTAKHFVVKSAVSAWSVMLEIPRKTYYAPMIGAILALALAVLTATALAILGGRWAGRRLGRAVASLAAAPGSPVPAQEITEISAARRLLDESFEKREKAETARRDSEQRARAEIREAARKLALSEARLRGIFESATDAIVTADEEQNIVMANPAAARMFGYRPDELIGAPLDRLIPARYHEQHRLEVQAFGNSAFQARRMGSQRPVMGLRASGGEFPIDAAISHLTIDHRRLYTVILRDITTRVRAENELRRYADIVDSSGDAILSRLRDGTIVTWNPAAQRLFGYTREEILGKDVDILYSPHTPPEQRDLGSRAARGEQIVNVETLRRHKDGSDIAVSLTISPVRDAQGAIAAFTGIFRDISERKRMDAELHRLYREQRRAEAVMRESRDQLRQLSSALQTIREEEKTRIARELHDELGQALTALKMDAMAIAGELEPSQDALRKRADNMRHLIDTTVQSVRRIAADLRPAMLDNLGLAAALEWLAKDFSGRTGITVDLDLSEDDLNVLGGDAATAIFRIAQEALTNVARHAGADFVSVELHCRGGQIVLRISDNGKGLTEADTRKARSFGLLGMQERTYVLGGDLKLSRAPLGGTLIEAFIPAFGTMRETPA